MVAVGDSVLNVVSEGRARHEESHHPFEGVLYPQGLAFDVAAQKHEGDAEPTLKFLADQIEHLNDARIKHQLLRVLDQHVQPPHFVKQGGVFFFPAAHHLGPLVMGLRVFALALELLTQFIQKLRVRVIAADDAVEF